MLRTKTLRAALLLPAALAVSFLTSVGSAKADTRLDAQLAAYILDEGGKPVTAATAQANDLVYAVYTVLFNNPNLSDAEVAATAKAALETTGGKTRKDRSVIVGRIISAAIYGSRAEDNPARVKAILDAVGTVNAGSKNSLSLNGKALAIATALRVSADSGSILPSDFSNPSSNAGAAIAASASNALGGGLPLQTAVAHALATGVGVNNLAAYYNGVLDTLGGDKQQNALTIASAAGSQPAVVGAVIAGLAADITQFGTVPNDTAIKNLVAAATANAKLKKSINGVVSGGFRYLSAGASRGAAGAALLNSNAKLKASAGMVAEGALQARDTVTVETTDSVLNAILTAAGTAVPATKLATFAGQAALGNASDADEVITFVVGKIPTTPADSKNVTAVANAVIKSIAFDDPASISDAAAAAANARAGALFNDSTKGTLAAALAKGAAKNYTAAGAAVAGVISTMSVPANSAAGASAAAIKANAKATTAIAQQVSLLLVSSAAIDSYAQSLAGQVAAANAGGVAAGAALADPTNTGKLVTEVVNKTPATQKQILKIASTVATAVDIERVGDVAKAVGALIGTGTFPKVTSFASLATALTKAINAKPLRSPNDPLTANAGWHNRVDEIGELAATLVNSAISTAAGKDPKILASIATGIYKGVSKRLLANSGNNLADIKDVVQDVAGAIFQTISVASGLTAQEKTALLTDNGALEAAIAKAAGKTFSGLVATALDEVQGANGGLVPGSEPLSNGGTGKYEVGNIVDPETPAKNV